MNHPGNKPLYQQLYQLLKYDILSGKYESGAHLPPERQLCELYKLDRTTVRKCLKLLSGEGLIERHRGLGTVVAYHDPSTSTVAAGNLLFALYRNADLCDMPSEPFYAQTIDALEQRFSSSGDRLIYSALRHGDDINALAERIATKAMIVAGDNPLSFETSYALRRCPLWYTTQRALACRA